MKFGLTSLDTLKYKFGIITRGMFVLVPLINSSATIGLGFCD